MVSSFWPFVVFAAPPVGEIVNNAIKAVQKTSYKAQLKFISQVDGNTVREVEVYHLAPDLYRVIPTAPFVAGEHMVENAQELVRIDGFGRVMQLPRRQFAINDALTIKFLRDLSAMNPPTTVLSGRVGQYETWMLRQDMVLTKPYIITVGIDKQTWFPLFLMVVDGEGRARVYYEVEQIEYRKPGELPDALFKVPEAGSPMQLPGVPDWGLDLMRSQSSPPLPLFPAWLPANYRVEALSLLRCPHGVPGGDCALVYQLEVYGPRLDDLVSIFQMRAGDEAKQSLTALSRTKPSGYVVSEKDGWVVAVFGDLPQGELKRIAERLTGDSRRVEKLLEQTVMRDGIMQGLREQ